VANRYDDVLRGEPIVREAKRADPLYPRKRTSLRMIAHALQQSTLDLRQVLPDFRQ
jgi:hypothetical protein